MTSKIFQSILTVAIAVLAASLVIIIGVLYPYFGGVQESQLKDELSLAADATEQLGERYLEGLDYDRYRLTWVDADGKRVQLTYKEFELLRMFLSHPGMVYTREQLFSQVWKLDYMGDSRTLDSHIRTLRQKLDSYGKMIETVRNVGYRWEVGYDK